MARLVRARYHDRDHRGSCQGSRCAGAARSSPSAIRTARLIEPGPGSGCAPRSATTRASNTGRSCGGSRLVTAQRTPHRLDNRNVMAAPARRRHRKLDPARRAQQGQQQGDTVARLHAGAQPDLPANGPNRTRRARRCETAAVKSISPPTSWARIAATTPSGTAAGAVPSMTSRATPGAHCAWTPLQLDQHEDVAGEEQRRLDDLTAADNTAVAKRGRVGFEAGSWRQCRS